MLIAQQYEVLVRIALLEGERRLPARPVRALGDDVGDLAQHDHRVIGLPSEVSSRLQSGNAHMLPDRCSSFRCCAMGIATLVPPQMTCYGPALTKCVRHACPGVLDSDLLTVWAALRPDGI